MSGIPLPKTAIPLLPDEQEKLRRYFKEAKDLEQRAAEKMAFVLELCETIGGRASGEKGPFQIDVEFRALIPQTKAEVKPDASKPAV